VQQGFRKNRTPPMHFRLYCIVVVPVAAAARISGSNSTTGKIAAPVITNVINIFIIIIIIIIARVSH